MKSKNLSQNYSAYKHITDVGVLEDFFHIEIFCTKFSPELKRRQLQAFSSSMYLNLHKLPSDRQDYFHNAFFMQFISVGGYDYTEIVSVGLEVKHYNTFRKTVVYRNKIDQDASKYLREVYSLSLENVGIRRRLLIALDRFPLAFANAKFNLGEEVMLDILPETFYAFVRLNNKDKRWMKNLFDLFGPMNHDRLKRDIEKKVALQLKQLKEELS